MPAFGLWNDERSAWLSEEAGGGYPFPIEFTDRGPAEATLRALTEAGAPFADGAEVVEYAADGLPQREPRLRFRYAVEAVQEAEQLATRYRVHEYEKGTAGGREWTSTGWSQGEGSSYASKQLAIVAVLERAEARGIATWHDVRWADNVGIAVTEAEVCDVANAIAGAEAVRVASMRPATRIAYDLRREEKGFVAYEFRCDQPGAWVPTGWKWDHPTEVGVRRGVERRAWACHRIPVPEWLPTDVPAWVNDGNVELAEKWQKRAEEAEGSLKALRVAVEGMEQRIKEACAQWKVCEDELEEQRAVADKLGKALARAWEAVTEWAMEGGLSLEEGDDLADVIRIAKDSAGHRKAAVRLLVDVLGDLLEKIEENVGQHRMIAMGIDKEFHRAQRVWATEKAVLNVHDLRITVEKHLGQPPQAWRPSDNEIQAAKNALHNVHVHAVRLYEAAAKEQEEDLRGILAASELGHIALSEPQVPEELAEAVADVESDQPPQAEPFMGGPEAEWAAAMGVELAQPPQAERPKPCAEAAYFFALLGHDNGEA